MTTSAPPAPTAEVTRIANRLLLVTSDAIHLYQQMASLAPPTAPGHKSPLSPLMTREQLAIQEILADIEKCLQPQALRRQPRYSAQALDYLRQQVHIYRQNTRATPKDPKPENTWVEANQALHAQVQNLLQEIEDTEAKLLPELITKP